MRISPLPRVPSSFGIRRGLHLVSLLAFLMTPSVHAALYACTDASGTAVITDSPAQLRSCTPLGTSQSATPERKDPIPEPPTRRATEPEASRDPQTQPPVFSVPLERLGSLWVVTVQVNGTRPAKLILDTGASHTMLSYAVARDLGLWALHPATPITMQTAGGTVQADVLPIASIRLGGAEVHNTAATIYDLPEAPPGIDGLLGQNVLGHFEVTVNAEKGELRLRPAK